MLWLLLIGLCAAVSAEKKSYEGYKLFYVTPKTVEDVKYLGEIMTASNEYDFWTEPHSVGRQVDILVPPQAIKEFVTRMVARGLQFVVSKNNVQNQLNELWTSIDSRPDNYVFDLDQWNTLADIYTWMDALPTSCKTGVTCQTYTIGTSIENRPIKAFKVSKTGSGRRIYFLDSVTHAREWLSLGTLLKIMDHVVNQYGTDPAVTRLVDSYDFLFIPVVNPDGYQYTWDSDRLWRKNRRSNGGNCYGIDINRNFDFRWGTDGVSHQPCADTYCGPAGNSEPETQAVANEYARYGALPRALLTIHSYGYYWMWPWGNYEIGQPGQTCDLADDHQDLLDVGVPAATAVENTYGTRWIVGNSCEAIYAATGATDDYSKGALNIKYAYTAETRGNSFVVPTTEIEPSFREIWNGFVKTDEGITTKHGPNGP